MPEPCIFCEIVAGRQNAQIVYQDKFVTAFNDRFPRAPVHILIVPNNHISSVNDLSDTEQNLSGQLILIAQKLASENGISSSGFRIVINSGPDARQSVHHLHLHLLGGKRMPLMGG